MGGAAASAAQAPLHHREEVSMLGFMRRSIVIAGAATLAAAALLVLPPRHHQASAQSGPLLVNVVEYDIQPGQIDAYLAALKENAAAAVKEPGCREFNILVSQKDPNHVLIFEVYDDAAAAAAHRETDHFKKYAAAAKDLFVKREVRPYSSVAMNMKGK
jgi:(4S)-4-hydroxy-5-phosphonooxypentane-2,3-dione isomerase